MSNKSREIPVFDWAYEDPMTTALLKTIVGRPKRLHGRETYASAFVADGQIMSIGRNMQVFSAEGWPVVQGYANHAELMAYSVAVMLQPELSGGVIYVIGLIGDSKPFIHQQKFVPSLDRTQERFTCNRCAKKACECGVEGFVLPSAEGWKLVESPTALKTAQSFHDEAHNNGDGRKKETFPFTTKSSEKLLSGISVATIPEVVKLLETKFAIHPFVYSLLQLAEDGYVDTADYKQVVNAHLENIP